MFLWDLFEADCLFHAGVDLGAEGITLGKIPQQLSSDVPSKDLLPPSLSIYSWNVCYLFPSSIWILHVIVCLDSATAPRGLMCQSAWVSPLRMSRAVCLRALMEALMLLMRDNLGHGWLCRETWWVWRANNSTKRYPVLSLWLDSLALFFPCLGCLLHGKDPSPRQIHLGAYQWEFPLHIVPPCCKNHSLWSPHPDEYPFMIIKPSLNPPIIMIWMSLSCVSFVSP